MAPIGYSGPWGKRICEKNQELKISCQTPFKYLYSCFSYKCVSKKLKMKNCDLETDMRLSS
jgi:hypothetical protein